MSRIDKIRNKVKSFPLTPGVYLMKDAEGKVIYVGKAGSLRKRVLSYFSSRNYPKTESLIFNVADIEYINCQSQEQALILEASLIKEKKPRYNVSLKDDKSYPYIEITKEKFSRVQVCRIKGKTSSILFGPYPNAGPLRPALNLLRKIFPFRTCRVMPKTACLFYHLQMCPAPCVQNILLADYRKNIQAICRLLKGERRVLLSDLKNQMKAASVSLKFEKAAKLRDKILAIENLYGGKPNVHELICLKDALKLEHTPLVIEGIDIANLSGSSASGSVVVFRDGVPDKNNYRQYRIKSVNRIDDYAMIQEVVRRRYSRLKDEKWPLPDLVVIDGGLGHVATAKQVLDELGLNIRVIGIAKENEEIWFPQAYQGLRLSRESLALQLIQRIRDEAHRFCRRYHFVLRKKKMVE
jgi:excinuclease ABC subunit C